MVTLTLRNIQTPSDARPAFTLRDMTLDEFLGYADASAQEFKDDTSSLTNHMSLYGIVQQMVIRLEAGKHLIMLHPTVAVADTRMIDRYRPLLISNDGHLHMSFKTEFTTQCWAHHTLDPTMPLFSDLKRKYDVYLCTQDANKPILIAKYGDQVYQYVRFDPWTFAEGEDLAAKIDAMKINPWMKEALTEAYRLAQLIDLNFYRMANAPRLEA